MTRRAFGILLFLIAGGLPGADFTVTNTNDSGAGSLRQAILDANASMGLDTIAFDITGPRRPHDPAAVDDSLISDAVIIDGFTQSGSSPNTLLVGNDAVYTIEIDGTGIPFTNDPASRSRPRAPRSAVS